MELYTCVESGMWALQCMGWGKKVGEVGPPGHGDSNVNTKGCPKSRTVCPTGAQLEDAQT